MVFIHIDKTNYNRYPNTNQNPIVKLDSFLHSKKVFILVYMEGCGPCNKVRPEWAKIKNVLREYQNRDDIAIVDIDKDLINKLKYIKNHPNSFPAIRHIHGRGEKIENYEDSNIENKDRTIDSFVEWIKSKDNKPDNKFSKKTYKKRKQQGGKTRGGKWSTKYKRSINCRSPKGFSQKQYCKYGHKK